MSSWLGEYGHVSERHPANSPRCCAGVPFAVDFCSGCGRPIADRYPRWAAVRVTPDSESGAPCEACPHRCEALIHRAMISLVIRGLTAGSSPAWREERTTFTPAIRNETTA